MKIPISLAVACWLFLGAISSLSTAAFAQDEERDRNDPEAPMAESEEAPTPAETPKILEPNNGPLAPGPQPREFRSSFDKSIQPYNLYVPKAPDAETSPALFVVLHGHGATWKSWFDATKITEFAEEQGAVVAAPHGRGNWFYLGPGEQDVLDIIAEVKTLCRVDPDRVFLVGHSMGGWGAWHLAASHPDLFAGIVPMAGWAPIELLSNVQHNFPLVFHGDTDDAVSVEFSRAAVARLGALLITHRYEEKAGVGHESAMISDVLPEVAKWMRDRRRVTNPAEINLRAYTPARGKAWWLSMHRTREFPKIAGLSGRVDPSGRVLIHTFNLDKFAVDPALLPARPAADILPVTVDEQDLTTATLAAGQIYLYEIKDAKWSVRIAPMEYFRPEPMPMRYSAGVAIELLPKLLAGIMARAAKADTGLMIPTLVPPEFPGVAMSIEQVIDLFCRPEDELCVAEISVFDFNNLMENPTWSSKWWAKPIYSPNPAETDPRAMIRVVMPRVIANRFPVRSEGIGISLREVLVREILTRGTLQ